MLFLVGCAHYGFDPNYKGPATIPEKIKKTYAHQKYNGPCKEKTISKKEKFTLKQIEFASCNNILPAPRNIIIDYYDIRGKEKTPVILVLPILGGGNVIAKKFATFFANKGYSAAIVHRQDKFKEIDGIDTINSILMQMVYDHKQAIDWIETQEDLDTTRIGVFGVSMGSIKGALVSSLDPRVQACVLALVAGDIPYVITYTKEKGVRKKREQYLKANNLDADMLYERLKKQITCDPIHYASYLDANKAMVILARFDRIMPYAKGKQLWKEMGKPEIIYLLSGHYTAVVFLPYIQRSSFQFFREKFEESTAFTE